MRDGEDHLTLAPARRPLARRPRPRRDSRTTATPVALTVGIGAFVLIAVLSVLAVGAWSAYRNTADLLHQKAALVVDAAVARLSLHLGAAEEQTIFVARALAEGEVLRGDLDAFVPMLGGALAATPQINALYFLDTEHRLTGVERDGDGDGIVPIFAGLAQDPDMRQIIAEAADRHAPYWADLLWRDTFDALHVNLRTPVWRDGRFQGVVMALVSVPSLSLLIGDLESQFGYNAYILLDEQRVLAHPLLQFGFPGLTRWKPMPTTAELGDPVLNVMWTDREDMTLTAFAGATPLTELVAGARGHTATLGTDRYVFLYKEVPGFGPRPWLVGTYLRASGLTEEIDRLAVALAVCAGLLAAAVVVAGWIGVSIARPARRLAWAAEAAARLETLPSPTLPSPLPPPEPVPGSRFRELDQAITAFNAMRTRQHGLNAHGPRHLVGTLEAAGRLGRTWRETREVTVLAARLPLGGGTLEATQAALSTLSALSAIVTDGGGVLEAAGARGILAWWGGLEMDPEAPVRAPLQALEAARRMAALPGVGIGLDCGEAEVAAVVAGDRLAVTVGGLVPARAEALARLSLEQGLARLAATTAVVRAADLNAVSLGRHALGDAGEAEIFRLS